MLDLYSEPSALPGSEAGRIGMLLGLKAPQQIDDVGLAEHVSNGLHAESVESLASILGRYACCRYRDTGSNAEGVQKKNRKALSREVSDRLYNVSRVLDAVSRTYHG